MNTEHPGTRGRAGWITAALVVLAIAVLAGTPAGRRFVGGLFGSLRSQQVQSVNLNLSSFVGPTANPTVQQMISNMISDRVTTTLTQKSQPAANAAQASKLAGYHVLLPAGRQDLQRLIVAGKHALTITVDRARLQAILDEAGHSDLKLPASIDGAHVQVQVAHIVHARFGTCPQKRPSATANIATPTPNTTRYSDCLLLTEGPSPRISAPSGLTLAPLAQIGLEAAGMSSAQAARFLRTVNWRSALAMPIPRFMRSYETVSVNGAPGTLLNLAGRRGATYTLIWARAGMVYSLTGFGNPLQAVKIADSLS